MKKTFEKIARFAVLLITFFLMVSSLAFASFNEFSMISESAAMIVMGIGLISLGGFVRATFDRY